MELIKALRLDRAMSLAWVGAGGKTRAIFHLARQVLAHDAFSAKAVLVTTTTHLGNWQAELADRQISAITDQEIRKLFDRTPEGIILISGTANPQGRLGGLDDRLLGSVKELADYYQIPLLIEADGSRQLPLKAPAAHEPAIPAWVDAVVVVAGLSGLGNPLTAEYVQRSERFAALAGIQPGEPVTPNSLAKVLTHPQGGVKHIPAAARRIALLNQADTPELQAAGYLVAAELAGVYDAVLIAALQPGADALPEPGVLAAFEPAAGIVLAAGGSRRLGYPKQLLSWQGEAFARRVARTALEAGLSPVIVVTGAYRDQVEAQFIDLPVRCVDNPDWESGQGSSVACGVGQLPANCGSAVFLLADQPQIQKTLVHNLVQLHCETLAPLIAPLIDGERGNPVLFDRQTFPDLLALKGESGGRALFSHYPVTWLPWHDAKMLIDIDNQADYQRLMEIENGT